MAITVKTPSSFYEGYRAGVFFRNGTATLTEDQEHLTTVFKELGYEVIQLEEKKAVKAVAPGKKRGE